MNHPLAALGLIAVTMVILSTLFAEAQRELDDPRTFEPDDFLLDQADEIDPSRMPALDADRIELDDIELPRGMDLRLPEGTLIDGNVVELAEGMMIELPEGTELRDFAMTFDQMRGLTIPEGTTVEGDTLVFPPGTVLEFDDGTVLPLPEGGRLQVPGYSEDELRAAVEGGHIDAPAGSRFSAPVVRSPGGWPMYLPAGSRFILPYEPHEQGRLDGERRYHMPPGTRIDPNHGGGSGGGAGGMGGAGHASPEDYDEVRRTSTDITGWSSTIRKGEPFEVRGWVHQADGSGLAGAGVRVYVNETKTTPGRLVGEGVTNSVGDYNVQATFPSDLEVGDYQLVAQHVGLLRDRVLHTVSWSDPPITVRDGSLLFLDVPDLVGVDVPVRVHARLVDMHGVPVEGAKVTVQIEDRPAVQADLLTDAQGRVELAHTFTRSGPTTIGVRFDGNEHLDRAQAAETIEVVSLGFVPDDDTPPRVSPGETLVIAGTITNDGEPLAGGIIRYGIEAPSQMLDREMTPDVNRVASTQSVVADADGRATLRVTVPDDAPLGRHLIGGIIQPPQRTTYGGHGAIELTYEVVTEPVLDAGIGPFHLKQEPDAASAGGLHGLTVHDHRGLPLERVPVQITTDQGTSTRALTGPDGTARYRLPLHPTAPTTVTFTIAESAAWDALEVQRTTVPVIATATTQDVVVRGMTNEIGVALLLDDTDGRPIERPWTADPDDLLVLRGTTESATAAWNTSINRFQILVPFDAEPGPHRFLLDTPLGDEPIPVDTEVLQQTLLRFVGLPRDLGDNDDGDLALTLRATDDNGTARARETIALTVDTGSTAHALQTTTDDEGFATFSVPREWLQDAEAATFTADIGRDGALAPASTTKVLEPSAGWLLPLVVLATLVLLGALGYAAYRLTRQPGGLRAATARLDPRPEADVRLRIDQRPWRLPLAAAPNEDVTLDVQVRRDPRATIPVSPGQERPATETAAPIGNARVRLVAGPIGRTTTTDEQGHAEIRITTAELARLPPRTPLTLHVAATGGHRQTRIDTELRVAPWNDQFRFDHDDTLDAARAALPDLPEGCTPRGLVDALERRLPRLGARVDLHAWVLRLEAAGYGHRSVEEQHWVAFAKQSVRVRAALDVVARKRREAEARRARLAASEAGSTSRSDNATTGWRLGTSDAGDEETFDGTAARRPRPRRRRLSGTPDSGHGAEARGA